MKKIKSLKLEQPQMKLSSVDLRKVKGGSGVFFGTNDPDKPGVGDGDPPPEIGTDMARCYLSSY